MKKTCINCGKQLEECETQCGNYVPAHVQPADCQNPQVEKIQPQHTWKTCRPMAGSTNAILRFREPAERIEIIKVGDAELVACYGSDYVLQDSNGNCKPIHKVAFHEKYEIIPSTKRGSLLNFIYSLFSKKRA